ncbi:MAG: polyhydroxyalkanoate depolymerase [Lautropia sp.]|nr:polyhydroxyalkanoate depolymerase [Lautropia sp.]
MLYQMHEAQRAVLAPLSAWAEAVGRLYANPLSPLAHLPGSNRLAAGMELFHRLGKTYEKPEFGIPTTEIDGTQVAVTEKTVIDKPFCKLVHFERQLPASLSHRAHDPVVLIFAPLSGHHATLLRDTVRTMLPDHNVYITDWVDARIVPMSQGDFHLHDYVAYAVEFIRHLGPNVHLVAVCQPTVPVLAAVSIMASQNDPKQPLSMTLMGGPIDSRRNPTAVNELATGKPFSWFERTVIQRVPGRYPGAGRRVYPGFLQHAGFITMNPGRHAQSHWDFYLNLVRGDMEDAETHRAFYNEYNAVLDLSAEFYLETIRTVFQDHALPEGTWNVPFEGETVNIRPEDIRKTALMTVEGELDDISGVGQTSVAHELCSSLPKSMHVTEIVEGAGHYGIFSGRRWRRMVYPKIRSFIARYEKQAQQKAEKAEKEDGVTGHRAASSRPTERIAADRIDGKATKAVPIAGKPPTDKAAAGKPAADRPAADKAVTGKAASV